MAIMESNALLGEPVQEAFPRINYTRLARQSRRFYAQT
jgi:hypothetical protein